jgi:hypothetical protein
MDKTINIMATSERLELAETTGTWRWENFSDQTLDVVLAAERQTAIEAPMMPKTLVLLAGR